MPAIALFTMGCIGGVVADSRAPGDGVVGVTVSARECPTCPLGGAGRTETTREFGAFDFDPYKGETALWPQGDTTAIEFSFAHPDFRSVVKYHRPVFSNYEEDGDTRSGSAFQLLMPRIDTADVALVDADGDGVAREAEAYYGTDPLLPDTDGDGFDDGAELYGIGFVDLPSHGASPLHRDVFVELDVAASAPPLAEALADVVALYASLAVTNPDGTQGVNVHFLLEQTLPARACIGWLPEHIDTSNFHPHRRAAGFRYMMTCNKSPLTNDAAYGYASAVAGTSFVAYDGTAGHALQRWVIAHELGHLVGLAHGGGDGTNNKPNYPSIMSYATRPSPTATAAETQATFAFSRGENPPVGTHRDYDDAALIGEQMGALATTLHLDAAGLTQPGPDRARHDTLRRYCNRRVAIYQNGGWVDTQLPAHCEALMRPTTCDDADTGMRTFRVRAPRLPASANVGFNLDGRVSYERDIAGCNHTDGFSGVDNSLLDIVSAIGEWDAGTRITSAVLDNDAEIEVVISHWNETANDACVVVHIAQDGHESESIVGAAAMSNGTVGLVSFDSPFTLRLTPEVQLTMREVVARLSLSTDLAHLVSSGSLNARSSMLGGYVRYHGSDDIAQGLSEVLGDHSAAFEHYLDLDVSPTLVPCQLSSGSLTTADAFSMALEISSVP